MFLTDSLIESVEFKGIEFKVDMSFNNILLFYELQKDKMPDEHKLLIGLEMLLLDGEEYEKLFINDFDYDDFHDLYTTILVECLNVDLDIYNKDQSKEANNSPSQNSLEFDFDIDGERIYASFLMDYGIDLIDMQNKLHWRKFIALLDGLSDNTVLKRVIKIRTEEIPEHLSAKDKQKLRSLKNKFSLQRNTLQSGLSEAARILKSNANIKKK